MASATKNLPQQRQQEQQQQEQQDESGRVKRQHETGNESLALPSLSLLLWDPQCPPSLIKIRNDRAVMEDVVTTTSTSGTRSGVTTGSTTTTTEVSSSSLKIDERLLLSDLGCGCNEHELIALMKIITAHEEYHQWRKQQLLPLSIDENNNNKLTSTTPSLVRPVQKQQQRRQQEEDRQDKIQSLQVLSNRYRHAVMECIDSWRVDNNNDNNNDKKMMVIEDENLDLLLGVYSAMHLWDVFIPLLLPSSVVIGDGFGGSGGYHDAEDDPFDVPGAATANLVRYLRLNHMDSIDMSSDALLQDMMTVVHPERYTINDENIFWKVLIALVLRGCLADAWTVLSKHSLYVAAMEYHYHHNQHGSYHHGGNNDDDHDDDDEYFSHKMKEAREGFTMIKELMLTAPIPGGRTDEYDRGHPDLMNDSNDDNHDNKDNVGGASDDAMMMEQENVDQTMYIVEGLDVTASDFRYWEVIKSSISSVGLAPRGKYTGRTTSTMTQNQGAGGRRHGRDMPLEFSPSIATSKHQRWRDCVRTIRTSFPLERRIPELAMILDILSGEIDLTTADQHSMMLDSATSGQASSSLLYSSWAEEMCSYLLYRQPNIRPRHLSQRARRIIDRHIHNNNNNNANNKNNKKNSAAGATTTTTTLENTKQLMISFMDGDVGQAIQFMYLLGGQRGAALPSTLTALFLNFLHESNILPASSFDNEDDDVGGENDDDPSGGDPIEFLCDAASAILSSLTITQRKSDVGVQLAIRLLIPYASTTTTTLLKSNSNNNNKKINRTTTERIISMIASILETYTASDGHHARAVITSCRPLIIKQKCVQILDGCVAVLLDQYQFNQYHQQKQQQQQVDGGGDDDEEQKRYSNIANATMFLLDGMELEAYVLPIPHVGTCYRRLATDCCLAMQELLHCMVSMLIQLDNGNNNDVAMTMNGQGEQDNKMEKMRFHARWNAQAILSACDHHAALFSTATTAGGEGIGGKRNKQQQSPSSVLVVLPTELIALRHVQLMEDALIHEDYDQVVKQLMICLEHTHQRLSYDKMSDTSSSSLIHPTPIQLISLLRIAHYILSIDVCKMNMNHYDHHDVVVSRRGLVSSSSFRRIMYFDKVSISFLQEVCTNVQSSFKSSTRNQRFQHQDDDKNQQHATTATINTMAQIWQDLNQVHEFLRDMKMLLIQASSMAIVAENRCKKTAISTTQTTTTTASRIRNII